MKNCQNHLLLLPMVWNMLMLPFLASNSILIDKGPDLPSQEAATNDDSTRDVAESNERQELATGSAHEFNEAAHVTFHAEPELPDFNRASATEVEQPSCEGTTDHQDTKPFDDALSESLSSIACGVGKFHLKPRMRGLAVKSKQLSRKVADKAGDEARYVNGEEFGSFGAFRIQEGHTEEISGLEKATQDSDVKKTILKKKKGI